MNPSQEMSGWRSMESAPRDGSVILLQHVSGVNRAVYLPRKNIWVSPDGADAYEPLRWQPVSRPIIVADLTLDEG